jgi:phospho-N-acetylmuramoyl-pentapeptide-transferase
MFFYLSQLLLDASVGTEWERVLSPLRLFRYITFRTAGAAITALFLSWWLGPKVILWLKELKFGQNYQDRAEELGDIKTRMLSKKGTPTMGGLMIVLVIDLTVLLWAPWNTHIQLTLLSMVVLCGLGFYDDFAKITKQSAAHGATELVKLVIQFVLAGFIAFYLWRLPATRSLVQDIMLPFWKYPVLTGGVGAGVGLILVTVTIVGSSNAVNLTDGLDGLAIGCTIMVAFVFLIFSYVTGHFELARYLHIPFVPGVGELTVFCAAIIGAGLGFLWYNCHPAKVFMGDTGSLPLGGVLGIIAVLVHQPLVLVIAGGVFVAEAMSVIIQRGYFKYTKRKYGEGRRVFLMSPIHHHFEKKGWYESQVVMRFYILSVLCAVIALSSLKIR